MSDDFKEWMMEQVKEYHALVINNELNKPLVTVAPDGTVKIYGDVDEAARRFWGAVERIRTDYLAGRTVCSYCLGTGICRESK